MVWKKDLAKLKQDLKNEEPAEPKRPALKPVPKPAAPRELVDEDALFLAAMGGRRQKAALKPGDLVEAPPAAPPPAPAPADFEEAMTALKGLKPVPTPKVLAAKTPPAPPASEPAVAPEPEPAPAPVEPPPAPRQEPETPPEPAAPRWTPPLIQLAAGMAIDVDAALDLRGHSGTDALERLKERLLDGHLLGWRTLHVHLGPSEALRNVFLEFLASQEAALVARYAQAPIPMGGAQAWILYLGLQGQVPH